MVRLAAKSCILLVMIILLSGGMVLAENRRGAFSLTPSFGYHVIDGGMDLEDQMIYGLAGAYNFTEHWTIEGDARFTPSESDVGSNDDIDVWTLGLGGLYHFQPEKSLNPYLALGIGGMIYDIEGTSHNDEDYMGYWGGGAKYAFSDLMALRLDLRHVLNYRSDKELTTNDDDPDIRHHLQVMAGLTFQFGGTSAHMPKKAEKVTPVAEEAPAPIASEPADSDNDRVIDANDKCPGTRPGVRVDTEGCPTDTDGDGVPDYRDACLATPSGTPVGEDGCPLAQPEIVSMALQIYFGFDRAQVTPFHFNDLQKAADFINEHPEHRVEVEGHTDSVGTDDYNMALSQRRAESVRQVLIEKYGADASRVLATGKGTSQPASSNATRKGRSLNRRVEVNILP